MNTNIDRAESKLRLISGTVSEYSCVRRSANFVFSDNDKTSLGVVAVAASIAGGSGLAASTAASSSAEEEADFLSFKLDGKQVEGWVWRSPFANGDYVEVIAEPQADHFEVFAIARPLDRIVALYPHCSRGRIRHWITVAKWWGIGSMITLLLGAFMFLVIGMFSSNWHETIDNISVLIPGGGMIVVPFYLLMSISMGWKWMSFVRLAEKVFDEFEWPDPMNIDLKRISRKSRNHTEAAEYGVFYFRY